MINGDYLALKTFAGFYRYCSEILQEFDLLLTSFDVEMVTPEYVKNIPRFQNIKVVKYGNLKLTPWRIMTLPYYVKKQDAIMIDLSQALPFGVKGINCVHDCIPEIVSTAYSGFFNKVIKKPLKMIQRKWTIRNCKALLTVSEFSKSDIIRIYGIDPSKITVVYSAWQQMQRISYDEHVIEKYKLQPKAFYFTLGSRVPHKNLDWIVAAANQNTDKVFVISGENSFCKSLDQIHFPSNIIFTGYISDSEVKTLMHECRAFILPSFYEGFGLPPLEALAVGAEIIVSNTACLPEIYGDSAHYIDPNQLEKINMDTILETPVGDPNMTLERYSWSRSAELMYEVLMNCLEEKK